MTEPDGMIHVMPTDAEHVESKECWCEPTLDYIDPETGNEVWLHKELQ